MTDSKKQETAKKKDKKASAADERLFTVPLRKEWLKVPLNKRAKRSVRTIKAHLSRHMKVPEADVRISAELNKSIWIRGAGKPSSKIRLKAVFDAATGNLNAMLPDEKSVVKDDKKAKKQEDDKAAEANAPAGKEGVVEDIKKVAEKATSKEEVKKAVDNAVAEEKAKPTESQVPDIKAEPEEKPKETAKEDKIAKEQTETPKKG